MLNSKEHLEILNTLWHGLSKPHAMWLQVYLELHSKEILAFLLLASWRTQTSGSNIQSIYRVLLEQSYSLDLSRINVPSKINHNLVIHCRLECYYAPCTNSPSFNCKLMLKGEELGTASDTSCKTFEHSLSSSESEILTFTCILTRNKRSEEKQISIKGKG